MTQTHDNRSRRKTWLLVLLAVFGLPILLCSGVFSWYMSRQSAARHELDRRVEDLSQRGEPVDNESLQLFYDRQTSDESTKAFVAAGKVFDTEAFNEATFDMPFHGAENEDGSMVIVPRPGEEWMDRKPVDDFLLKWRGQIDTSRELGLHQYTAVKPVRRPIEFNSLATLLPDTQHVREMARLVRLEHAVAVYDGDADRAYDCIRACRGLERSLYGEPLLVSQLVGQAIGAIAGQMMQRSIEHGQLTKEQMDELAENLPTFQQLHALYIRSMRGERAGVLPIFTDPEQAKEILEMESGAGAKFLTSTRSVDAVYFLDTMERYLELPDTDIQSFMQAANDTDQLLMNDVGNAGVLGKMDRVISFMLLPGTTSVSGVLVRRVEHNHLIKLAMALRNFQREFKTWPKSLDELSKINVDVSKLQALASPFGYRIEPNGQATLWGINRSAGPSTVPMEPPEVKHEDSPNAAWVWRLRP